MYQQSNKSTVYRLPVQHHKQSCSSANLKNIPRSIFFWSLVGAVAFAINTSRPRTANMSHVRRRASVKKSVGEGWPSHRIKALPSAIRLDGSTPIPAKKRLIIMWKPLWLFLFCVLAVRTVLFITCYANACARAACCTKLNCFVALDLNETFFNKILKNVSCEHDRLNGWNSTLHAWNLKTCREKKQGKHTGFQ